MLARLLLESSGNSQGHAMIPSFSKNTLSTAMTLAVFCSACAMPLAANAESVLTIAMTAADIPRTSGQPDQGFEGNRFTGIPMYDALVGWDLSSDKGATPLTPGLATSWIVDETDKTKWIFKLRPDVRFHDGSPFNAEAVVWNVGKVLDKSAAQYDPAQVGATVSRMPTLKAVKAIDAMTVEITTTEPDAFLPYNLTNLFMASPVQWQKKFDAIPESVKDPLERSKQAWNAFASEASGTGPFKLSRLVPRSRLEIVKNDHYWNPARVPKLDKVVLIPMPEASARTAALMSGQVDWIEAPAPDALEPIKARGNTIYTNVQPHIWPWQFSLAEGSPWADKRVRQAANLCVDREGMKGMLGGLMAPAQGVVAKSSPWWGTPTFDIKYDPDASRKLMQQAGFSESKPVKVKVQISASGSGQMQPLPMNEYIQQNLKECFFDVQFDVVEWNTLFNSWRLGAKDASAHGAQATNVSAATMDPFFAMVRFVSSKALPPVSNNWGYVIDDTFDDYIRQARTSFDPAQRDVALAKLHTRMVDEAVFLYVAHDVGPRAISNKVKGVVQPQSWFIDIATMSKE